MMAQSTQIQQIEQAVFKSIAKYGNWLLVGGVSSVLTMMIVPMNPNFLDFLLAINIVAALTILLVSISVSTPLKLASFPTILLLATLFRLGLNISSTRLILTDGYAGDIIQTFGEFASGGSVLTGLIIFLIITLIQFIVIAKGSERVAEVSARFSLDALPGKQMSIDADLRAGLISQEEAKRLRHHLHQESKLYGSMDGAMKFVKGDTIAGLLITAINLLGGLFMGVHGQGLDLNAAIATYSLLTIGDGLVSQIPALLISMTAGFVVTRVTNDEEESSLGADMGQQLFSQPKALLLGSGLSLVIGMLPGFPFILFAIIALILGGVSLYLMQSIKQQADAPAPIDDFVIDEESELAEFKGQAAPFAVEVGPELYQIFQQDPRWVKCLGAMYPKLRLHLSSQLGVHFPDLKICVSEALQKTYRYRLRIFEVPVDFGIINPQSCSLIAEDNETKIKSLEDVKTSQTVHGTRVALLHLNKKEQLNRQGMQAFGPEEMLIRHIEQVLRRHAGDFVGIQEVRQILNNVELTYPEVVREVVPKMMSIQKLTEVVKRLVEEGVPIKDFRLILQTLSTSQPESKDPVTLTEQVRIGLKRMLTYMYSQDGKLPMMTIDSAIEDEIRNGIQKNGDECYLALPPERLAAIKELFKENFLAHSHEKFVILTQLDIRRYVRKIIDSDFSNIPVLSGQELDPKAVIEHVSTVSEASSYDQPMAVTA